MTHFVLHNPHAANGNGMEIYEVSDAKKMLDRIQEIFDGSEMTPISKEHASMIIDGRFDDLRPRRKEVAIRDVVFACKSGKNVYIYAATMGKAK